MEPGARLVEFKARYEDLGKARALLGTAERVGTFRQVDTYFLLGDRRLKVRTVEGRGDGQLIYYDRPDHAGVKESDVLVADLADAEMVLRILRRAFPVKAEVRKVREVYRFQRVQVHLDSVEGLGRFIEFEMIATTEADRLEARKHLEALRTYFQIPDEDIMASSYSDLLESHQ